MDNALGLEHIVKHFGVHIRAEAGDVVEVVSMLNLMKHPKGTEIKLYKSPPLPSSIFFSLCY